MTGNTVSKEVIGRGSIYTLGTAAPILAQLAVTPFATRLLGATDWGVVAKATVVIQVTMILASLGMPAAITRQAILGRGGMPSARWLMVRGSVLAMVLLAVALAVAPLWWPRTPEAARWPTVLALTAGTVFVVVENAQSLLRAQERPGSFVALSVAATLGGPLVGLFLVARAPSTPVRYLGGLLIGYAAAAAVGILLCIVGRPRDHAVGDLRTALRLGVPVLPHLVALYLATGALVFVANALHGEAAAGRIQLALLVGVAPGTIVAAVNNSWAPAVYRAAPDERGAILEHSARDIAVLAGLLAGGVGLLSPWLLRLVADERFAPEELVSAVCLVSVGSMLTVAYLANVHLVFASGHALGLALVTPLSLLFGVGAAVVVGRAGMSWVAIGFPLTYAALAVGTARLRRHLDGPQWRERALTAPFAAGSLLVALGAVLPASGVGALWRLVAATLVAAVAGWVLFRLSRR